MCFIKWWSAQKTSLICCCCCSISCKLLKVHWFGHCCLWRMTQLYTFKKTVQILPTNVSFFFDMTTLSMMIDPLNKMPIKRHLARYFFLGLVLFPWMTKGKDFFQLVWFPNFFFSVWLGFWLHKQILESWFL